MLRGYLRVAAVGCVLVCLVWFDACLYLHVQTTNEWDTLGGGKSQITKQDNIATNVANGQQQSTLHHRGGGGGSNFSSAGGQLGPVDATIEPSVAHNRITIYMDQRHHRGSHDKALENGDDGGGGNIRDLPALVRMFSWAFNGMSIKLMMTDPVDNYIMGPLAESFARLCNFRDNFHFMTANWVSYAGVVSALVSARLLTRQDSFWAHKLAFVLFQVRTWLDDLDGVVARARLGITKHVSLSSTSGYVIDGVCDAIGFVAFVAGCYIYLENSHHFSYRNLKDNVESCLGKRRLLFLVACFLLQLALCAAFWNRYILIYRDLLEQHSSPESSPQLGLTRQRIIKSNIMFIIVWLWRLTNGHWWMQMLAISVLMGKMWQFLEAIKFIGFVEILVLAAVTELHILDIRNYLSV